MNVQQQQRIHRGALSPDATLGDRVAEAGFSLALLAGIAAVLAGLGSGRGWWHFVIGFSILKIAAIAGLVAAALSLSGVIAVRHEHRTILSILALLGIVIGLTTVGIPGSWMLTAKKMPRIHDISTDTGNPPQFEAIMPLRQNAMNSAVYGGRTVAEQQKSAFPDIRPLHLALGPAAAFNEALNEAKAMGWTIVAADASRGRIEAMATTFWFGFKDDIVVRVTPVQGGSIVDMRSVSRVGLSDIGTNAKRVRSFLGSLERSTAVATARDSGAAPGY